MAHDISDATQGSYDTSIFGLISRLSEIVVKDVNPSLSTKESSTLRRKVRSSMYETLLGKKHVKEVVKLKGKLDHMSSLSWLIAQRFTLSQAGAQEQSSEFNEAIKEAELLGWNDAPPPVLKTMIYLIDSPVPVPKSLPSYEPFSLSQTLDLTGNKVDQRGRIYPALSPDIFKPPPWMKTDHKDSASDHYRTSFPFHLKPGEGLPLFEAFCGGLSERKLPQNAPYKLRIISPLQGPRELIPSEDLMQSNLEDEGYITPMTDEANSVQDSQEGDPTQVWSDALEINLPRLKSWETLGCDFTQAEPPFIMNATSEAHQHLSTLVKMYDNILNKDHVCDLTFTSRVDFAADVFLLLVGVETKNFPFVQESDSFVVRRGMWLEGYCVDDTASLCQDFLFCGTHFRRLENLCGSRNSTAMKTAGLIAQSLNAFVQRWIQFYYGAVLYLSSQFKSQGQPIILHKLLMYTKTLKQQVDCLSQLCQVSGPISSLSSLPGGVALLAHMYGEACLSNCLQSNLLYSALKTCCEVYLRCLQQWIFLGDCSNSETNEFFVHQDPYFSNKRDRSFWTRGFILDKKAVPDFLLGLETAIFDCGKAINLLQLCNPQHPFCILLDKKHPALHCSLYKSDLDTVKLECAKFEAEAQRVCGDLMTVRILFDEENQHEAQLHVLIQKAQSERAKERESMKILQWKIRAEMKEKQNADLKAQISEIQERKAAEKEQKLIDDEFYLLECQRLDNAAKIIEEEARLKLIAHYEELNKVVEKQNRHRDWQLRRAKIAEKRQAFFREDGANLTRDLKLPTKSSWTASSSGTRDDDLFKGVLDIKSDSSFNSVVPKQPISISNMSDDRSGDLSKVLVSCSDTCDGNGDDQSGEVLIMNDKLGVFKEASAIKAKVMQVEYSIVPQNLVNSVNNAPQSQTSISVPVKCKEGSDREESSRKPQKTTDSLLTDGTSDEKVLDCYFKRDLEELLQNRKKVLTESDCWTLDGSEIVGKKISKDSGLSSERDRNRHRVLDSEYNIITGSTYGNSGIQESQPPLNYIADKCSSSMSDLEKNRRKVLNEEFNIFTGGKVPDGYKAAPSPLIAIKSDSGIDIESPENCDLESHSLLSSDCNKLELIKKQEETPKSQTLERPQILPINQEVSGVISPLPTPYSVVDMPVFTSPFKGTNHLPKVLPLASPLPHSGGEKETCFEVRGMPLMVDILDNFASNFDLLYRGSQDTCENQNPPILEPPKTIPNTSYLGSSLQTCLLLPLKVQYKYVSASLLHFFLVDLKILNHFKSLRSYYFMQDGEFGRHLTVKLFTQMYQVSAPCELLNTCTLDKVVTESLAGSQSASDPNNTRINLSFKEIPEHFSHSSPNVLDCLALTYKVQWPLNLLLTPEALEKYNLIFLFLIRLKRLAWLLQEDYVALKNIARGCYNDQSKNLLNSPQYHEVQMMRHSMSQFVQATLNYVSCCVLHASWTDFASSLKQATTVDHIYNAHIEYMKRLLKRCLLNANSKRTEAVLSKIFSCIIKFHSQLRVRRWHLPSKVQAPGAQALHYEHLNFPNLQACFKNFKLLVSKLVSYLEKLISPPNQQQHLAEYLLLLNINGFFKASDYLRHAESDGKSFASSKS